MNVSAINFVSIFTHCESLSARYCKLLGQYADPLCVYISMLVQATLIVRRQFLCHYFHVNASSCATMSIYCVSISARYCKQLCQYVYSLCVYLYVTESRCVSMSTYCGSLSPSNCKHLCQYVDPLFVSISLLQTAVPECQPTVCLYLHVTASFCASMSALCVSLSPRYFKQLCQYVDTLSVSISTLLQAARPYVAPMYVSICRLQQAAVPICRTTFCLYFNVTASISASMSTHCVWLSPHYCKQLCL